HTRLFVLDCSFPVDGLRIGKAAWCVKLITALEDYLPDRTPSVFLAGGITNCPDWQAEMTTHLQDEPVTLLNPRRCNFPIGAPDAAPKQIAWEHRHLRLADAVLFWFPCETLCPIVLYELGAWSMTDKPLFVGAHPAYERLHDVVVQTGLVRADVLVVFSMQD